MRKIIATPRAMINITPQAAEIITYANLMRIGANLDLESIPAEDLHLVEYFELRRRKKEEEEKFKILFEGLSKLIGGIFK